MSNGAIVVAFAGAKGAGKSEMVRRVKLHLLGEYAHCHKVALWVMPFARTLKKLCVDGFGANPKSIYGTPSDKEGASGIGDLTGRQLMQRIGTEVGRAVHPDAWLYAMDNAIASSLLGYPAVGSIRVVLIDDLRFPNELAWVRRRGGLSILLERNLPPRRTFFAKVLEVPRLKKKPHASEIYAGELDCDWRIPDHTDDEERIRRVCLDVADAIDARLKNAS